MIQPINQWREWIHTGPWNWSNYSLVEISFEHDRVDGLVSVTLIILGLGFILNYLPPRSKRSLEEIIKRAKDE